LLNATRAAQSSC